MGSAAFLAIFLLTAGLLLKLPRKVIAALLGVYWLGVLVILYLSPSEGSSARALGVSLQAWLSLGGVVALVWLYSIVVKRLKNLASKKAPDKPQTGAFSAAELDRYARHIILHDIGGPGQKKLKDAKVLVIGAGGLGSPSLMYLAAAGVGTIGVIDHDVVDNSNLQRQIIHTDERIGMPKVFSAERAMKAQNPHIEVRPYNRRLDENAAAELFAEYDLILDGTDNFDTRYMVNKVAVRAGKPLISAAISQWEGQISLFRGQEETPCYQCVFPEAPSPDLAPNCSEVGVLGPLPGIMGAMMAAEAVKFITGAGQCIEGRMMMIDALYGENRMIKVKRSADCPVCGQGAKSE